jgi:hypothetical protein
VERLDKDAHTLASELVGNFQQYITSNTSARLDSTFRINVEVYSVEHTNSIDLRQGNAAQDIVGSIEDTERRMKESTPDAWSIQIPKGFKSPDRKNVGIFNGCCLIAACCIGYYLSKAEHKEGRKGMIPESEPPVKAKQFAKKLEFMCKLHNPKDAGEQDKTGQFIIDMVHDLVRLSKCNSGKKLSLNPQNGQPGHVTSKVFFNVHKFKDVQVHMWEVVSTGAHCIASFPEKVDLFLPQVHILREDGPNSTKHCRTIIDFDAFFQFFGGECLFCKKNCKDWLNHVCSKGRSCFSCKRVKLELSTDKRWQRGKEPKQMLVVNSVMRKLYCDSDVVAVTTPKKCTKCNMVTLSQSCLLRHEKICHSRFHCDICNKTVNKKKGDFGNQAKMRLNHKCSHKTCPSCYAVVEDLPRHQCQMTKQSFDKKYSRHAFIAGSCQSRPEICVKCDKLKEATQDNFLLCDDHMDMKDEDNLNCLVFLSEKLKRGRFTSRVYLDSKLPERPVLVKNKLRSNYFPPHLADRDKNQAKDLIDKKTEYHTRAKLRKMVWYRRKCLKAKTVVGNFLAELFHRRHFDTLIMAHGNGMELDAILIALVDLNIRYDYTFKGNKLIILKIPVMNIVFHNYAFFEPIIAVGDDEHFFPQQYNQEKNYHKNVMPDDEFYYSFMDTPEITKAKATFLQKERQRKDWVFVDELVKSATVRATRLLFAVTQFTASMFQFQADLVNSNACTNWPTDDEMPYLQPLKFCSTSAFGFGMLKGYCLDSEQFYSIMNEHLEVGRVNNVSHGELEYLSYTEKSLDRNLVTAFSSELGQKKLYFGKETHTCDGYEVRENADGSHHEIIYEYNGCYHHVHGETCLNKPEAEKVAEEGEKDKPARLLIAWSELEDKLNRLRVDREKGGNTVEWVIKWECEWQKQKIEDPLVIEFMETYSERPLVRLAPSLVNRPAFVEAFKLQAHAVPGVTSVDAIDKVSLYPWEALGYMPSGKHEILIGKQAMDQIKCEYVDEAADEANGIWPRRQKHYIYEKGIRVELVGLCQVRAVPPKHLLYPFLFFKNKDLEYKLGLCRLCMDSEPKKNALVFSEKVADCTHSNKQRAFDGCYTMEEASYAVSLGYQLTFHEVHWWRKVSPALKAFMLFLFNNKLRWSGYPEGVETLEQKETHCRDMNIRHDFHESIKLTVDNVRYDANKRRFAKMLLVCTVGKLNEGPHTEETKLTCTLKDYEATMNSLEHRVTGHRHINSKLIQLTIKKKKPARLVNRRGNSVMHYLIVSRGRISMHKDIMKLQAHGIDTLMVQTDALVLERPFETPLEDIVEISPALGCYQKVYPGEEIESFTTLGTSSCSYVLFDKKTRKRRVQMKIQGFCLDNDLGENQVVTHDLFQEMLQHRMQGVTMKTAVPQARTRKDMLGHFRQVFGMHFLSNQILKRRKTVVKKAKFQTFPFGHSFPRPNCPCRVDCYETNRSLPPAPVQCLSCKRMGIKCGTMQNTSANKVVKCEPQQNLDEFDFDFDMFETEPHPYDDMLQTPPPLPV